MSGWSFSWQEGKIVDIIVGALRQLSISLIEDDASVLHMAEIECTYCCKRVMSRPCTVCAIRTTRLCEACQRLPFCSPVCEAKVQLYHAVQCPIPIPLPRSAMQCLELIEDDDWTFFLLLKKTQVGKELWRMDPYGREFTLFAPNRAALRDFAIQNQSWALDENRNLKPEVVERILYAGLCRRRVTRQMLLKSAKKEAFNLVNHAKHGNRTGRLRVRYQRGNRGNIRVSPMPGWLTVNGAKVEYSEFDRVWAIHIVESVIYNPIGWPAVSTSPQ